jgi:predicted P-loop ATPase
MARVVGPRWMIGAVARGLQPGAKMDNSLILEGIQGVRKSSAAEALVPWESLFLPFASDPGSKDALENMQGAWIVELAEMAMLSRGRDMRTIKDFISRRTDRYRAAYGYVSADRPRRCVFFGTINPEGAGDYLADSTGNRRWWPVRVTAPVDVERLRADRDQLWAEAVARFDAGEAWHIEPGSAEEAIVAVEAGKRAGLDEWASILEPWMSAREHRAVTIAEVMRDALEIEPRQMDRAAQMRVAIALRQLGWEPNKGAKGARTWHKSKP